MFVVTRLMLHDEDDGDECGVLLQSVGVSENHNRGIGSEGIGSSVDRKRKNVFNLSDDERRRLLEEQTRKNKFHKFVEGNLIIKQGNATTMNITGIPLTQRVPFLQAS